jgi:hypothetical protein
MDDAFATESVCASAGGCGICERCSGEVNMN